DLNFFQNRIQKAFDLRQKHLNAETNAYRLIYGENDFLPGLIVDCYGEYLVLQFHTKAIMNFRPEIVDALLSIHPWQGIYERNDKWLDKREEVKISDQVLSGNIPDQVIVQENSYKFLVDIKNGQKTGFFLDQREKRRELMRYIPGENLVNCFSYTGGFSVYALAGGAKKVTSVDISAEAIAVAKENIKLNGFDLDKCEFIVSDVRDYLREQEDRSLAVLILDPPAFIKERQKIKEGLQGYRNLNKLGIQKIKESGILLSCSCSSHLDLNNFRYLLNSSANDAKRHLQILSTHTHDLDHPELLAFTETEYLKSIFLRVWD
ncbi:MAG TPA: class I SAM-dependent rRNA methyltransferase, partial [Candidatus Gracilibacteria bacterium]|nr:class I SAM-dependent rRNA methyltransferase [Candidatus Gracilibacteria bacterium]